MTIWSIYQIWKVQLVKRCRLLVKPLLYCMLPLFYLETYHDESQKLTEEVQCLKSIRLNLKFCRTLYVRCFYCYEHWWKSLFTVLRRIFSPQQICNYLYLFACCNYNRIPWPGNECWEGKGDEDPAPERGIKWAWNLNCRNP